MYLSLNWLKKYIDLPQDLSVDKLAHDLTMSTVEVEGVVNQAKNFDHMVVGRIVEIKPHPNADKLKLTTVETSHGSFVQIVCGGTNLKENMLVPVALPGAKVRWHGQGDLIELSETKIRGESSFGMICASTEIGLGHMFPCPDMEVTDLSSLDCKVGVKLADALGLNDVIIDLDNKSITHRPDLWGYYGIARELAAIYDLKLKPVDLLDKIKLPSPNTHQLAIEIKDKKLCSRYIGCLVENIKIQESPDWLKTNLLAAGMRPINNIVDITNYVMLELGQPLHAFTLQSLDGNKIIIRRARRGEKLTTLDGQLRQLEKSTLVIADDHKPIAIAGVMGGGNSEINQSTTSIILEAANFDGISVRKTASALSLRTEASARFEKSLDPNLVELATMRALHLIEQLSPGCRVVDLVDENYVKAKKVKIAVSHKFIESKIGAQLDQKEIVDILEKLGFVVEAKKNGYTILVPSWRATGDVSIPEDIVEEVARIYGYERIKADLPNIKITPVEFNQELEVENKIKTVLSQSGSMHEVYNYSFLSQQIIKNFYPKQSDAWLESNFIKLLNPLSEDLKFLRASLIPGLLKNIRDNSRYYDSFRLFEIGRVFYKRDSHFKLGGDTEGYLPFQPKMLSGVVVLGKKQEGFFETKGLIELLSRFFGCSVVMEKNERYDFLNPNKSLVLKIGTHEFGFMGEVQEYILSNFDIKNKNVNLFEIDLSAFVNLIAHQNVKYQPLPQYPGIEHDIALELDYAVEWGTVKHVVEKFDPLIRRVDFVSIFDLGSKKSLAFRVYYQSDEKTLTSDEVDQIEKKLISQLGKETGGILRK